MPTREGDLRSWAFDRTASKRYDVYEWQDAQSFTLAAAGTYTVGCIRAEGAGTVRYIRALVGDLVATAAAVGSLDMDVRRATAGNPISGAATMQAAVLAFATDGIATENTWTNAGFAAGGTRVAAGDMLVVVVAHGGGGAPTGGENAVIQVCVEPDA